MTKASTPRSGTVSITFHLSLIVDDGGHAEKRQLGLDIPGALSGAGGLLSGLLGAVAQNVAGGDKVPDAAHPYQVSMTDWRC